MSLAKICAFAALLALASAQKCGDVAAFRGQALRAGDDTYCFFCADGSSTVMNLASTLSCSCAGKKDCVVELNGEKSSLAAYLAAGATYSSDTAPSESPSMPATPDLFDGPTPGGPAALPAGPTAAKDCPVSSSAGGARWCFSCADGSSNVSLNYSLPVLNNEGSCNCDGDKACVVAKEGSPSTLGAFLAAQSGGSAPSDTAVPLDAAPASAGARSSFIGLVAAAAVAAAAAA